MIMFFDFLKMNKILFWSLIANAILALLGFWLYNRFDLNRFVLGDFFLALLVILILLAIFINVFSCIGNRRNILLRYRSKKYYLKYQLVVTVATAALITGCLGLFGLIIGPFANVPFTLGNFWTSPTSYISGYQLLRLFFVFWGYIGVYYICFRSLDTVNNSQLKYQVRSSRISSICFYLIRILIIGLIVQLLTADIVYWSTTQINIDYIIPVKTKFNYFVCLSYFLTVVIIIIDYIVYFIKKVIN